MKLALIAIGLFVMTGQASLAFARGGGLHLLDSPLSISTGCPQKFLTL